MDFNINTNSMSLYTEDMCALSSGGGGGGAEDMWESVIVKDDIIQEWSVTSEPAIEVSGLCGADHGIWLANYLKFLLPFNCQPHLLAL